jgi:molybdopterin synthase catalytic subunit
MRFLSQQPIDIAQLARLVTSPDRGALVTFCGQVRNHHGGREVTALAYSAYEDMAEHVAAELITEATSRFGVAVAARHRLGDLVVGDIAVALAVAAAHRDPAYLASRWLIDEIKTRVPIWKRERYRDGTESWVDPTAAGGIVPIV